MLNHVTCDPFKGDFPTLKKVVIEAERLGYRGCWTNDFLSGLIYPLQTPGVVRAAQVSTERWFEAWTMITALAASTKNFRVGTLVLSNPLRHPVLLAKMVSTLDVISHGRVDFGIGAGLEFLMKIAEANYGMPFIGTAERLLRLREALRIMKLIWAHDKAGYHGQFYSIKDCVCEPKPVQKPHPPIWVGGRGNALMKIAAELADGYNGAVFHSTPEQVKRINDEFDQECRAVGRNPSEVRRAWQGVVLISESEDRVKEKIRRNLQSPPRAEIYDSVEDFVRRRIVGTPEQCIEQIMRYIGAGVTDFILYFPDAAEVKPMQLFSEKVVPRIS